MSKVDRYFDKLMGEYYKVLINSWNESVQESARFAIKSLVSLRDGQRADEQFVKDLEYVLRQQLGDEFASALDSKVKTFTEMTYRLSSQEGQFQNIGVKLSFTPTDMRNIEMIKKQQVFWLREHYNTSVSEKLQNVLTQSIEQNMTKRELASSLQQEFSNVMQGGKHYFAGLAEHTSLRVREFARLNNYKKCGATHYKIVAILDDKTSDICRALHGKIFPLKTAMDTMDAMLDMPEHVKPEDAKAELKRLAPFVRDDQVEYDADGVPFGVSGTHTPFPPFHWRCRTITVMVYD